MPISTVWEEILLNTFQLSWAAFHHQSYFFDDKNSLGDGLR